MGTQKQAGKFPKTGSVKTSLGKIARKGKTQSTVQGANPTRKKGSFLGHNGMKSC